MYSTKTGRFTSTSYYMDKHPQWWRTTTPRRRRTSGFTSWNVLLDNPKAYERALPEGQKAAYLQNQMTSKMGYLLRHR